MVIVTVTLRGRGVRVSHLLSIGAALAVAFAARESTLALAVGLAGVMALVVGMVVRRRSGVVLAGTLLFATALLAAAGGAALRSVLVAAFAAVLAADLGAFALGIERDADPSVATARVELLHGVGSATVALLAGGVGYALYGAVPDGDALGVVALLFGGVVLAALLRGRAAAADSATPFEG